MSIFCRNCRFTRYSRKFKVPGRIKHQIMLKSFSQPHRGVTYDTHCRSSPVILEAQRKTGNSPIWKFEGVRLSKLTSGASRTSRVNLKGAEQYQLRFSQRQHSFSRINC
jgi:hypothetical protein